MRGYFGIGVEGVSKPMNVGSMFRTANAFGASFVFTINAQYERVEAERSDTSRAALQVPLYEFDSVASLRLPKDCKLVGVEITEDAELLPSFRHPRCAAYVLGPERGSLSPTLLASCDRVVKIPTKFSINLAIAGALVMYDRLVSLGRFAGRPLGEGGEVVALAPHEFGAPRRRKAAVKGG
jgi:tRNA G18 (ribose-2'-O)-methylase SpoU